MIKDVFVSELTEFEAERICKDVAFENLVPESCCECGNKKGFLRRIFKIEGVPERKYADDDIQNALEIYFRKKYSIEHVFFKTYGKSRDYMVDSAICNKCKSTAITYDLSQSALEAIEKLYK
jgi:hypothetical protein